jgi:hypothetical protein
VGENTAGFVIAVALGEGPPGVGEVTVPDDSAVAAGSGTIGAGARLLCPIRPNANAANNTAEAHRIAIHRFPGCGCGSLGSNGCPGNGPDGPPAGDFGFMP